MRHPIGVSRIFVSFVFGLVFTLLALMSIAQADDPITVSYRLYRELKCPICEVSLEQSNAMIAEQMKTLIRQKVEAGESPEQIRAYFVERYGESVLVAPPKQGGALAAWIMPFVGMIIGGGVVSAAVFGYRHHRHSAHAEPTDMTPEDAALAARVDAEVRALES